MTDALDVEAVLSRLDLRSRIALLAGKDMWSLPALPAIGLPALEMSDGPIGVRGRAWGPKDPSVALPSPTALAASWDPELACLAGLALGQEARRKGVHVLLAPTINLHRNPRGGRHFECYSEDPLLTGLIAVGFIAGVQAQGVAATAKHFVANDSETERMTVDVRVEDSVLRQLYLLPFEMAVRGGVWAVMAAYNSVNGTTMSEHSDLVNGLLKGEWGFDGVVVSDWFATRSTAAAALGGLDIAMPAMVNPWTEDQLLDAVTAGEVPPAVIEDKARRVLRLAARVGLLGTRTEAAVDSVDAAAVAQEVAQRSFVLAANDGLLPLDRGELGTVAVIGSAAARTRAMGGGSAEVVPYHVVSVLDGLRARLGDRVRFAQGTDPAVNLPVAAGPMWTEIAVTGLSESGERVWHEPLPAAKVRWVADLPSPDLHSVEITAVLKPDGPGEHELSVRGVGGFRLEVDGATVWEDSIWPDLSDPIGFLFPPEQRVALPVTGEPVRVRLWHEVLQGSPIPAVTFHLGHTPPRRDEEELLDEAVELAASSDVAVVVVGTTEHVESEGFDRTDLRLPGRQDELVARVIAANPRTIVVVNAGAPVLLPWADTAPAVLLSWFPGQEAGLAVAGVLLGDAEPGGRLPTTWPLEETGPAITPVDGVLTYDEGLNIGYRSGVSVRYPFGHGLGYTTWEYAHLHVLPESVEVTVVNTGQRAGRDVVQVYLERDGSLWLAGFGNVELAAGEQTTASIALSPYVLRTLGPGTYPIHIGRSVADPRVSGILKVE